MMFTNKKLAIGFVILLMLVSGYLSLKDDTLFTVRHAIEELYNTEFNNSQILAISEREFPGKRANYKVFTVDSSLDWFPVLFDGNTDPNYDSLFVVGTVLNKAHESYMISLTKENRTYTFGMRTKGQSDDRFFGSILAIVFFGIVLIIVLVVPATKFEYKRRIEN